jgi:hypothetical protein
MNKDITLAKSVLAGAAVALVLEHVAKVNNYEHKPSKAINWAANKSMVAFRKLGAVVASLSSFYNLLKLDQFAQTALDLAVPTAKLAMSPYYTAVGYVEQLKVYSNPTIIICGTTTIGLLGVFVNHKYGGVYSYLLPIYKRVTNSP